jgi:hypothetical protein
VPLPIALACLTTVLCLAPLGVYLSWAAGLHRRPRPAIHDGPSDLAALLAGLAGFLFVGGGVALTALQSNVRLAGRRNWEQIQAAWDREHLAWVAVGGAYFALVVLAVVLSLRARRKTITVYNVAPAVLDAAVSGAAAEAGLPAERHGNVWAVPGGPPVAAVEPVPAMRTAVVRYLTADPRAAEEIDRHLRRRLAESPPADGFAAAWLTAVTVGLLVAVAVAVLLLVVLIVFAR